MVINWVINVWSRFNIEVPKNKETLLRHKAAPLTMGHDTDLEKTEEYKLFHEYCLSFFEKKTWSDVSSSLSNMAKKKLLLSIALLWKKDLFIEDHNKTSEFIYKT